MPKKAKSTMSPPLKKGKSLLMEVEAKDVLAYYPNLIGYLRVLCMFLAFWYYFDWKMSLTFYLLSFGGDVIDGYVARKCDQSSTYGGFLDMVTDRVATGGYLMMLMRLYSGSKYDLRCLCFQFLMILDVASHWFHTVSVGMSGHKSEEKLRERNALLRWYYSYYYLFGYCCVGAELYYVGLFLEYHNPSFVIHHYIFLPGCVIKQIVNIAQLASACYTIAEKDAVERNERDRNASVKSKKENKEGGMTSKSENTTKRASSRSKSKSRGRSTTPKKK